MRRPRLIVSIRGIAGEVGRLLIEDKHTNTEFRREQTDAGGNGPFAEEEDIPAFKAGVSIGVQAYSLVYIVRQKRSSSHSAFHFYLHVQSQHPIRHSPA